MKIKKLEDIKTQDEARQYAVEWQSWAGDQNLSYSDLLDWSLIFMDLGKNFNLTEEFKENGII